MPNKSIEQIAEELGRYPVDAFVFVQECIGRAAEMVHGELTPDQTAITRWMAKNDITPEDLRRMWEDGQLPDEAAQVIEKLGGPQYMNRHVTGQQLCWAIRDVAQERWGLLARNVLERWNITSTEDFGAIVFGLVDNQWLAKQPTDSIDDFKHVFNFAEAFDRGYTIALS